MKQIFLVRKNSNHHILKLYFFRLCVLCGIGVTSTPFAWAQFEQTAPSKFRIVFTDKNNSPYSILSPGEFLSARSIERRQKQHIPVTETDLPVNPAYIDSLRITGATVLNFSKWFNSATVEINDTLILKKIAKLSFVRKDMAAQNKFKAYQMYNHSAIQETGESEEYDYGTSWWQTGIHNGQLLHNNGYTGENIVIAVIDAGFYKVDHLEAFARLWDKGAILGTRDFVNPDGNVFMEASHGMSVLSIISSNIPGQLIGTAPDASFWLLRSEDVHSEYLIEEDNWIAAAEFADSAGADIITSSLGYSQFDNPAQNHTYQDMDGNTTRVSIAADMAASRGMLVVASAGNQGLTEWKYITAPADADSILTIGAVDFTGMITEFSSRGPSYDLRVKPTVDAIGMYTYIINPNGSVGQGDGTSFSAPVIAGLSACLWQSNPQASMMDIYNAICSSADRYYIPDDFYGYGIPNFSIADYLLKTANQSKAGNGFKVFPNPFTDKFYIVFDEPVNSAISITFYDLTGKEVDHFNYPEAPERRYILFENSLRYLPKGLYIVKVSAENIRDNAKLVKY